MKRGYLVLLVFSLSFLEYCASQAQARQPARSNGLGRYPNGDVPARSNGLGRYSNGDVPARYPNGDLPARSNIPAREIEPTHHPNQATSAHSNGDLPGLSNRETPARSNGDQRRYPNGEMAELTGGNSDLGSAREW